MNNGDWILVVFLVLNLGLLSTAYNRVCYFKINYYDNLNISSVDGSLCTHIIFGFAVVSNGTIRPSDSRDVHSYREAVKLKQQYPNLKVMLSVGGGGGDAGFHEAVASVHTRIKFTLSALAMMFRYGFDGLDIDWEFPSYNTPYPQDKELFIYLLQDLREAFYRQENRVRNRSRLLLSVAVSSAFSIINESYNVTEMSRIVDFINLMTYDFHIFSKYWPFTGFNAPLFARKTETQFLRYLNTNWSANYWNSLGMPKNKIMIGIPTYGRSFKLADPKNNGPDSAAVADAGDLTFTQACDLLKNASTIKKWDNEAKVPYLINGLVWSSYDDVLSVSYKTNWTKLNGFGGVMTFDLNADDYNYGCDQRKFVLHSVIKNLLTST